MNLPARRIRSTAPTRKVPALRSFATGSFFGLVIFFALTSRAQLSPVIPLFTRSVSGQFVVTAPAQFSWLFNRPEITANTNLIRLDAALLAVAAERFKVLLWQQLGLKADSPWRGKIYLVLHPAQSPEDDVTITSRFMLRTWDYQMRLPDILSSARYARGLSAVLLLEIANRDNVDQGRSAEIPAWLVDGLAQQVLDEDGAKLILSLPAGSPNGARVSSLDQKQHGLDPLASARITLQSATTLTFDQLSWPTDDQLSGDDGGVYRASAQLFAHDLLQLPRGTEKLRALLDRLPGCLNWQTAFFEVYRHDFSHPLDLEKWWSLRAIDFAAHNSGSALSVVDSDARLASLLQVPVQIRGSSNSLPVHAEISLQSAIRRLNPAPRDEVLSDRLRDLELAQFRLARPYAVLAAGYLDVLKDFLGVGETSRSLGANRHNSGPKRATIKDTLKKLDALDLRRQELASRFILKVVPRNAHAPVR